MCRAPNRDAAAGRDRSRLRMQESNRRVGRDGWRSGAGRLRGRARSAMNIRHRRRRWDRNQTAPAERRAARRYRSYRPAHEQAYTAGRCRPRHGHVDPILPRAAVPACRPAVAGCRKRSAHSGSVHTQIPLELPLADLSDVLLPFAALGFDEALIDMAAESGFDNLVLVEHVERFMQVARQLVDAVLSTLPKA